MYSEYTPNTRMVYDFSGMLKHSSAIRFKEKLLGMKNMRCGTLNRDFFWTEIDIIVLAIIKRYTYRDD